MPRRLRRSDTDGMCDSCSGKRKKAKKHLCNKYICCLCICEKCGKPYNKHGD